MINKIASTGVHAADITALRQDRAKKTERAEATTVETGKTQKPAHPAHPHGHIPPGLARAAEKIASKIFARADADDNGTVTQQELSAVRSIHARTLASSDLFKATTGTPTDDATATTIADDTTEGTPDAASDVATETTTETPTQVGITEAQLKEALTKSFYAKIGVTYTSPASPITEQPVPTAPANTIAASVVESISEESAANRTFTAVA